jgi:ABC-2 type transport system permease protein
MLRDKRTLALLFLAPLLVLSLMYFLFNGNTINPKIGVVNVDAKLVQKLKDMDMEVMKYDDVTDAQQTIIADHLEGLLKIENGNAILTLQNTDPSKSKALQMKINQA